MMETKMRIVRICMGLSAMLMLGSPASAQDKASTLVIFDGPTEISTSTGFGYSGSPAEYLSQAVNLASVEVQKSCSQVYKDAVQKLVESRVQDCKSFTIQANFKEGFIDTLTEYDNSGLDSEGVCTQYRDAGNAEAGYVVDLVVTCERRGVDERLLVAEAQVCEGLLNNIGDLNSRTEFDRRNCTDTLHKWEAAGYPTFELQLPRIECPASLPQLKIRYERRESGSEC